jgi:hypothetical protein
MVPAVSHFRVVVIECEGAGCDVYFDGDDDWYISVSAARRATRELGWTHTSAHDLCPECSNKNEGSEP